jgi:hypothetical protein
MLASLYTWIHNKKSVSYEKWAPLHNPKSKHGFCYSSNSLLIIIFGAIGVYLVEHEHQGANITKLSDAFWWAVVTITTVAIKNKIEGIEKLTEEDFDTLIVMIKSLRRTLLEESKISYRCSRCGNPCHSKPNFCSNCGLDLT